MEQHVPVSEDLVEKLTPNKDVGENEIDERNKILEGIAEVCMQQRQYHLATKKYTQAGNRVKVCVSNVTLEPYLRASFFSLIPCLKQMSYENEDVGSWSPRLA